MEHPGAPLLPAPRLLSVQESSLSATRYSDNVSYIGTRSRTGHGLHYKEIPRLWLLCHDVADAYRYGSEEQVCQGQDIAEQRAVLVQYGVGTEYGE